MLRLAVHVHELLAQLLQNRERHAATVNARAAASAAAGNVAANDQRPILGLEPILVDDCLQVGRERATQDEHAFDHRSLGPTANHVGAESISQQRADGVDQDRLASTGFAGDDVQPRPPLDVQVLDRGEVADRELLEHPALIITGAASG